METFASLRMKVLEHTANVTGFQVQQPAGGEGVQRATAKPSTRVRKRGPLSAAAAASRRFCVAARLSRAVTPERVKLEFQSTRMGVERAEGPSQESRGQRPLVGFQRAKPFGGVQGQSPWRRHFERIFLRNDCKMREDGV